MILFVLGIVHRHTMNPQKLSSFPVTVRFSSLSAGTYFCVGICTSICLQSSGNIISFYISGCMFWLFPEKGLFARIFKCPVEISFSVIIHWKLNKLQCKNTADIIGGISGNLFKFNRIVIFIVALCLCEKLINFAVCVPYHFLIVIKFWNITPPPFTRRKIACNFVHMERLGGGGARSQRSHKRIYFKIIANFVNFLIRWVVFFFKLWDLILRLMIMWCVCTHTHTFTRQ